ncbi:hypothetical protein P9305_15180 [Lysinibacillus capsici]|uniref:hypothetical protein n=1 Tax=Lysinibacillus capsici TaxID=2115968 RepID=UPI002E1B0AF1|nr:hypothetical protein [Lysinibacillus capsici]
MYKLNYGQKNLINFNDSNEVVEAIGYLANQRRGLTITAESYENKWGTELRLNFNNIDGMPSALRQAISAGNNSCIARLNNNEFVRTLITEFGFDSGSVQNAHQIRSNIPINYLDDFDRGYGLT